jgi:SAM-dependent methyltransferase
MYRTNGSEVSVSRSHDEEVAFPARGRWEGVCNVVRFNWPLYAVGVAALTSAFALAMFFSDRRWLEGVFLAGGAAAAYLLIASLLVSLWIYDLSPLYRFQWASSAAGPEPRRILNFHSGFDESSLALRRSFGSAQVEVMDFYDGRTMTEASIIRARHHQERSRPSALTAMTKSVSTSTLPVVDQSIDAAFAILAAHEIRRPEERLQFFSEIARGLRAGGRLVLVEHLRNAANFMAFGPQFVHFYSRGTWLQLARDAGFTLVEESRITPFIGLFVFQKAGTQKP